MPVARRRVSALAASLWLSTMASCSDDGARGSMLSGASTSLGGGLGDDGTDGGSPSESTDSGGGDDPGDDEGSDDGESDGGSDDGPGDGPVGTQDGPIIVDPEHAHWFRYEGGAPFFLCGPGDPEDFLHRGALNGDGTRSGDQDDLIAKLAPTGANGIYMQIVRSHGGDGDATHNPFIDHDPNQGLNEAVLDQWDAWFGAMNDAGIAVYLFLYDDSARVWNTGDVLGDAERAFVEQIVDRFEHHPRLVWAVAEEYAEALSPARVSAIASVIASTDDFGHPVAVHQLEGLSFDFPDDPAIDQFSIQLNASSPAEAHQGIASIFGQARDRYNLALTEIADHGTGATARSFSWASAMAGAYVMVLGQDIANTPVSDLEDCGRLVSFFEGSDFASMEPRDDLATRDTDYVLADPGVAYLLYAEGGAQTLGLADAPAGAARLRWLDPATGATVTERVTLPGGPAELPVPEAISDTAALEVCVGC